MKKRLLAFAGAAVLLASAAVPVGSAFAQLSTAHKCKNFNTALEGSATQGDRAAMAGVTPGSRPGTEAGANARLGQLTVAAGIQGCSLP